MIVFTSEWMDPIFEMLEDTRGVQQLIVHHPEGDVFIHSTQVLKIAFRESNDTDLILAAMLHDIGKKENPIGHEQIAIEWLENYVTPKTLWLIEHHMRIWTYILGDMNKLSKCLELANHPWFPELIQLARWDKKGRRCNYKPKYSRQSVLDRLNDKVPLHFKK